MDILHKNIVVSGHVQGVGFRQSCRKAARTYGIKGFVKNLPNKDVYIEAEGSKTTINLFLKWCNEGPSLARVNNVEYTDSELLNFTGFDILQ